MKYFWKVWLWEDGGKSTELTDYLVVPIYHEPHLDETLGTGEIDLHQRLGIAKKHDCTCVLETKTVEALKQSVKWLEENNK